MIVAWARGHDKADSSMAINLCSKHLPIYQDARWKTITYYAVPGEILRQAGEPKEVKK